MSKPTLHELRVNPWALLELKILELCKAGNYEDQIEVPEACMREIVGYGAQVDLLLARLSTIPDAFGFKLVAVSRTYHAGGFAVKLEGKYL